MTDPRLDTLRARIEEAIGGRRAAMLFAKQHDRVSYRTLQSWIDGATWPDAEELLWLSHVTGKPLEFFIPIGLPAPPALLMIPILDVTAHAGAGRVHDVISTAEELPFPRRLMERLALPDAKLACLRCSGDSMQPTITDGAILIVDEQQKKLPESRAASRKATRPRAQADDIYVFFQGDDLRMKRLRKLEQGFVAIYSDNHRDHPIEIFRLGTDGALVIVGKVIWWDNRL